MRVVCVLLGSLLARATFWPSADIRELSPLSSHMLITRPTESVALEDFVLDRCEKSTHMAILAYLNDMRGTPNSASFRLCQRVFYKCQALVFEDTPNSPTGSNSGDDDSPASTSESIANPAPASTPRAFSFLRAGRVRENTRPAVIGIGAIAAAFASPLLVEASRNMVIAQGRRWRTFAVEPGENAATSETSGAIEPGGAVGTDPRRSDSARDSITAPGTPEGGRSRRHSLESGRSTPAGSLSPSATALNSLKLLARIPTGSPSLEDLSRGSAFSFTRYVAKTSTQFSLHHPSASLSTSTLERGASDPLDPGGPASAPESIDPPHRPKSPHPPRSQRHLISSHYFHSELQFVMTLVEISDRLRSVPKEARQSTLVAELTLLNHNLPADVCIPLWCLACKERPWHHRIVRISPGDAVVLNSADRVPYLITVEVVENEAISSTVVRSQSADMLAEELVESPTDAAEDQKDSPAHVVVPELGSPQEGSALLDSKGGTEDAPESSEASHEKPDRQVADASSAEYHRIVLDRRSSLAVALKSPTGATGVTSPLGGTDTLDPTSPRPTITIPASVTASQILASRADEFAERMRTAAVMLAQLYQQQQRELVALGSAAPQPPQLPLHRLPIVVGAGGLPPYARSTPSVASSSTPPSPAGSAPPSPSLAARDRRKYQKLRTDFEEIRNRLIKEMMALEEMRVEALAEAQRERRRELAVAVTRGDEVLPEGEERTLQDACWTKDKEDPSGYGALEGNLEKDV
ncbi:hypothetical protein BDK51DRAFT_27274 [Blyttiomyces helicus]|uniref:Uncharacterized protein n=1 Tax=Blyttiomyces helicus TaxID=388810 RepID=A0A4P9W089_9FUNG|nr:hypothetical protein BDK51DRAFT_27274 [Blyttiomyces helicus]|eukprot:RKO85541.1 hypothetical protein BDK51DRAFT_27274 [Blyttiomyces helicus]